METNLLIKLEIENPGGN